MTSRLRYCVFMRRFSICLVLVFAQFITVPIGAASDSCNVVGTPAIASDALTVTVNSLNLVEKPGSYQLTISYQLLNATPNQKIDEGTFELVMQDGTSLPQYGFFGSLFPSDSRSRNYTWEYLKSQIPATVRYNAGFFGPGPKGAQLDWLAPGGVCLTPSQSVNTGNPPVASGATALAEIDAAVDAALAAADQADAATSKAQVAADEVAQLASQVSRLMAALKAQISSLTELVIKIQKKVRA
jgi:hypothetical protein